MKPLPKTTAFAVLLACHPGAARAAEYSWTGAAGDGLWHTPGNWKPSSGFPHSGDDVIFPQAAADAVVRLEGEQAVRSLTFAPVAVHSYRLEGGTLTLDDGGKIRFLKLAQEVGRGESAVQVIASKLRLQGATTFGNENRWYLGGELLRLAGGVEGAGTITIDGEPGGGIAFDADNAAFTGGITIRKGMLFATHAAALGKGPAVKMEGGTLWVSAVPSARDFTISGDASWSAVQGGSGPHTGTVTVRKGASWEYGTGGNDSKFTGRIAGEGNVVWKSGSHGTTVGGGGANTLSGSYQANGGLLVFSKPDGVDAVAGPFTVGPGTVVRWDANEQVADKQPVKLGGDFATLGLNGHRETIGTLDLRGNSRIVCGAGNDLLQVADSHGVAWDTTKELIIEKWEGSPKGKGTDRIRFGTSGRGVTPEQLRCIGFRDPAGLPPGLRTARILPDGEVVPGAAVSPVNPPYDLSAKAREQRRKLYEVDGKARLGGKGTPLKKDMKIAFFGDSITWGGGYLSLISRALAEGEATKDLGVKLINHGVNGGGVLTLRDGEESTAHVGDTKPRPFAEYISEDRPDVVVIYIGINDVWWRKTTPEDFERALGDLVATTRASGARPVLATLAMWGDSPIAANPNNKACDEFAELTRKVAAKTRATLVDLRKACMAYQMDHNPALALDGSLRFSDKGVLTGDGVHLNGPGAELVAGMISQGIFDSLVK